MTCLCRWTTWAILGWKSVIKLGKVYEKFNLEWIEDVIPWYYTDLLKEITDASPTPTITGEVPDTPGLGVTLNDDECKKHLKPGTGYFEPTPMWDDVQSVNDRLFS
jgi:L-alanine-DL-glutamate epimerase-like enolase superfamily enzyme